MNRLKSWLLRQSSLPQKFDIPAQIAQRLRGSPIVIADVGAAFGTDPRWSPINQLVHFVTFEPDPRSSLPDSEQTTNFATGLGAEPGRKTLHLTALPAASSVYEINHGYLDDFAVRDWLKNVGQSEIPIDTLDHCLESAGKTDLSFLKVDTEGSDLDILRGATSALDRSILGVEVEVTFAPRHRGAPFFADIDAFLRDHGFQLHTLEKEHWLRNNLTFGSNVNPQLIWGDAVYFLTYERLCERLAEQSSTEVTLTMTKLILLLLGYGFHDYAVDLIEKTQHDGFLNAELASGLRAAIRGSVRGHVKYFAAAGCRLLVLTLALLPSLPVRRIRSRIWNDLWRLIGNVSYEVSRLARRTGIRGACITEIS